MPNKVLNRAIFLKNIMYAFIAQGVSLTLSVIMTLFVPQILGIVEFSYWQLFLFFAGYCGFFHFGLHDGIYLRMGGIEYENLNKKLIGSQFYISLIYYCIIASLIALISIFFVEDSSRRYVLLAVAIYLPIYNAAGFIGYVFQAVNKTKIYSISVVIDKILFVISVLVLLFLSNESFIWLVVLFIVSKLISLCYCIWKAKQILFNEWEPFKNTYKELLSNIVVGLNLMFSNIAGTLILGFGRFVIDRAWGIVTFGVVSFSLLLSYFFLTFIGQISMVLFPALRQINETALNKIYNLCSNVLMILLPGILLAYAPINYYLALLLPQYTESLQYLIFLLPLCIYDGKMNLLCSTFFKVLRKEKLLLRINLSALLFSVVCCLIGAYIIYDLNIVILSMVVAVAFRSVISEIFLSKMMGKRIYKNLGLESFLVIIFIISAWYLSLIDGFVLYFIMYLVYLFLLRKRIIGLLKSIRSRSTRKNASL